MRTEPVAELTRVGRTAVTAGPPSLRSIGQIAQLGAFGRLHDGLGGAGRALPPPSHPNGAVVVQFAVSRDGYHIPHPVSICGCVPSE